MVKTESVVSCLISHTVQYLPNKQMENGYPGKHYALITTMAKVNNLAGVPTFIPDCILNLK